MTSGQPRQNCIVGRLERTPAGLSADAGARVRPRLHGARGSLRP